MGWIAYRFSVKLLMQMESGELFSQAASGKAKPCLGVGPRLVRVCLPLGMDKRTLTNMQPRSLWRKAGLARCQLKPISGHSSVSFDFWHRPQNAVHPQDDKSQEPISAGSSAQRLEDRGLSGLIHCPGSLGLVQPARLVARLPSSSEAMWTEVSRFIYPGDLVSQLPLLHKEELFP